MGVAGLGQIGAVAVFSDAQVRDVIGGPDGILAVGAAPRCILCVATVSVETARWAYRECAERGSSFVDCGVTGGRAIA